MQTSFYVLTKLSSVYFIYQIKIMSMERTLQRKSYKLSFVAFIIYVSTETYILASPLTETTVLGHLGI